MPPLEAPDAKLAEELRQGDPAAEEEFVRRFRPRVHAIAAVRLGDEEAARDLAQETLAIVLRAVRGGRLRRDESLAAFVHGTVRNLVQDHIRSKARQPEIVPLPDGLAAPLPPDHFESAERLRLVQRALRRLGSTDRTILLMTLAHGLKPAEIAERLGIAVEQVRTRKCRAARKVTDLVRRWARNPSRGRLSKDGSR
jgi:RNA polymerase sigma-70 factor (ECF subfamily)